MLFPTVVNSLSYYRKMSSRLGCNEACLCNLEARNVEFIACPNNLRFTLKRKNKEYEINCDVNR
jgi:hypothetical protein